MNSIFLLYCKNNNKPGSNEKIELNNIIKLSDDFSEESLDALEKEIDIFYKKYHIGVNKLHCDDKIISILSSFKDSKFVSRMNQEQLEEIRSIIVTNLNLHTDIQVGLEFLSKIMNLMMDKKIYLEFKSVYFAIYMHVLNFFIVDDRSYEIFFDHCVSSQIWQKALKYIRDFDNKNSDEIKEIDRSLYFAIFELSSLVAIATKRYYKILFKHRNEIIDTETNTIKQLGDLIILVANYLILNNLSNFFIDTIEEALNNYKSMYGDKQDKSALAFIKYLSFLQIKIEEYKKTKKLVIK